MVSNTLIFLDFLCREQPPPRGCVLKQKNKFTGSSLILAAASARLCVETFNQILSGVPKQSSRLRAAVC